MWNFKDDIFNTVISNFVKFMINPYYNEKDIYLHANKFLEYDTFNNPSNKMNIIYSKAIDVKLDKDMVNELYSKYINRNSIMTWCSIDIGYRKYEIEFFKEIGFFHSDTCVVMELLAKDYIENSNIFEKVKDKKLSIDIINDKSSLEEFVSVIDSAFDESLIDTTKYDYIYNFNKENNISKMMILKIDGLPVATGSVYFENNVAVLDDIATHPNYRGLRLAKIILNELIKIARDKYNRIMLISTTEGSGVYKSIGFKETDVVLNVFTTKKLEH